MKIIGNDIEVNSGARDACALIEINGERPRPLQPSDVVARVPDINGEYGVAWRCDLDAMRRHLGVPAEQDATLVHWVVQAPWAHPLWHSYSIVMVHLRPIPGLDTILYLPEASHELWVYVLDPKKDRQSLIDGTSLLGQHWLQPGNYSSQIVEISDVLALDRVERAVRDICAGRLSPDTDHVSAWQALFGDCMFKDRPGGTRPVVRKG